MTRATRLRVVPVVAALALLAAPRARAQEEPGRAKTALQEPGAKEACADAYEEAQRARKRGQLRVARKELLRCTRPACPAVLSTDCATWLRDVEASQPTIVLVVQDEQGRDVAEARVLLDDELVATRLEGKAVDVDPGAHRVRVEVPGRAPVDEGVVVREGEQLRRVVVRLASAAVTIDPGPAPRRPAFTPAVIVLGAFSAATLAGFAAFGARGLAKEGELDACKPRCDPRDVDVARVSYAVADVFLGVSVLALGTGAYLYFRGQSARVVARPGGVAFEARF